MTGDYHLGRACRIGPQKSESVRIGGLVNARCVKYLGNLATKLIDQETRDSWWSDLRDEIRSHAKILCCSHVVGYLEASTIHDDVCILSITGTAATVRGLPDLTADDRYGLNFGGTGGIGDVSRDGELSDSVVGLETHHGALKRHYLERVHRRMRRSSMGTGKSHENPGMLFQSITTSNNTGVGSEYTRLLRARRAQPCSYCDVPYHHRLAPFTNMKLVPCLLYPRSHPRNDGTASQTAHSRHGCLYSG